MRHSNLSSESRCSHGQAQRGHHDACPIDHDPIRGQASCVLLSRKHWHCPCRPSCKADGTCHEDVLLRGFDLAYWVDLGGTYMVPFTRERPYTEIPTATKKKWIDQVRLEKIHTPLLGLFKEPIKSTAPKFSSLTRKGMFHCHVSKVGDSKQLQLVGTPWQKSVNHRFKNCMCKLFCFQRCKERSPASLEAKLRRNSAWASSFLGSWTVHGKGLFSQNP